MRPAGHAPGPMLHHGDEKEDFWSTLFLDYHLSFSLSVFYLLIKRLNFKAKHSLFNVGLAFIQLPPASAFHVHVYVCMQTPWVSVQHIKKGNIMFSSFDRIWICFKHMYMYVYSIDFSSQTLLIENNFLLLDFTSHRQSLLKATEICSRVAGEGHPVLLFNWGLVFHHVIVMAIHGGNAKKKKAWMRFSRYFVVWHFVTWLLLGV